MRKVKSVIAAAWVYWAVFTVLCGCLLAQQPSTPPSLSDLGPENSSLASRVGLWSVVETTWNFPGSTPSVRKLVAQRRMIASFLEEVLESEPNAKAADIKRVDYLSFNRVEGRWKYVSMDTRAPVGIMTAASVEEGDVKAIHLIFEPFAILLPSPKVTGQLVVMQETIFQASPDHDRKDQYFTLADGTGKSWLGHRYEYTRLRPQ